MAQVVATINAADAVKLNRFILKLSDGLSSRSLREFVYTSARPYLQTRALARFAAEGDDASGPWKDLIPATQRIRSFDAARYALPITPFHPINRRTGALQHFVTRTFDIDEGWREVSLIMPTRDADSNLEKKLRHAQKGGTGRMPPTKRNRSPQSHKFPARPVAVMNETDKARLESRFGAWVTGMLRTIV